MLLILRKYLLLNILQFNNPKIDKLFYTAVLSCKFLFTFFDKMVNLKQNILSETAVQIQYAILNLKAIWDKRSTVLQSPEKEFSLLGDKTFPLLSGNIAHHNTSIYQNKNVDFF